MTETMPISLWDASAEEPDYQAPLDTDETVDVAIVGGGFTGLSTALHCAEKGQKVRTSLGPVYGPRFIKKFGSGPEYVFSLIEKHQMRCEVTRTGTIHAAHGPKGFIDLQERHKEWQRLGEPVDLLSREEVSTMIGTDHFHGGLLVAASHSSTTSNWLRSHLALKPTASCRASRVYGIPARSCSMSGVMPSIDCWLGPWARFSVPRTVACRIDGRESRSRDYFHRSDPLNSSRPGTVR